MSILNKIIGKFVGNKAERDYGELEPYVGKVNAEFDKLRDISNDELRAKTNNLKEIIRNGLKPLEDEIAEMKEKAESDDIDVSESEAIYEKIDKVSKIIDDKLEEVLEEILPEAFAIVKETARRFNDNEKLVHSYVINK